jgi:hypothetical protein
MSERLKRRLTAYLKMQADIDEHLALVQKLHDKKAVAGKKIAAAVLARESTGDHVADISFLLTNGFNPPFVATRIQAIEAKLRAHCGQLVAMKIESRPQSKDFHLQAVVRKHQLPRFIFGVIDAPDLQIVLEQDDRHTTFFKIIIPCPTTVIAFHQERGSRYELRASAEEKLSMLELILDPEQRFALRELYIGDEEVKSGCRFLWRFLRGDKQPFNLVCEMLGRQLPPE